MKLKFHNKDQKIEKNISSLHKLNENIYDPF